MSVLALAGCDPDSEPVGHSDGGGTDSGGASGSEGDPTTGGSNSGSDSNTTVTPMPSTSGATDSASASASDSDSASASDSDSDSASTSSDATDSGSDDSSGSDTGEVCDPTCEPCAKGFEPKISCDGDEPTCDCVPGSDCDLPSYVDAAAEGKTVPMDCGTVTLADTAEDYAAATACVLAASESMEAYTMLAQLQGVDSTVWAGYAGTVSFIYAESIFSYDGGGNAGGEFINRQDCTPVAVPNCDPGPTAGTCLFCDEQSTLVCSDPDA